jgi:hypothetical protein
MPAGWHRTTHGEWCVCVPSGCSIPAQGWKIHVSACPDNAAKALAATWAYCVPRGISFKFLRGPLALLMRNSKYAPRGSSGKLVTIYPQDEADCERILSELDELLEGESGPYILSDLRYRNGPLFVRYGGFSQRLCLDSSGELVPAIEDPSGQLVPDVRTPVFSPPPWATLPAFLAPHLAVRDAVSTAGLPYRFERALHFSNGGGVYAGVDKRSGERVVLKEARPHAGLAADGADAVTRLRRERDILSRLAGLPAAPAVRDYFELGEHHFLVQEFIEGTTLNSCYASRYPLIGPVPTQADLAEYTAWAMHVCEGAERAITAVHERGVIFNDLHMFNVIVRPDGGVTLIDFEAAAYADEGKRPVIGNPGFVAPRDRTGFAIDRYSLACLRLAVFMPLTMLIPLDPGKAAHLADVIYEHFPVPREFLAEAVTDITGAAWPRERQAPPRMARAAAAQPARPPQATRPADVADPAGTARQGAGHRHADGADGWPWLSPDRRGWLRASPAMVDAILASATPGRDDRLFPGDIRQFTEPGGGLGLAHGAAGVLYALSQVAGVRLATYEEWLIKRATSPPSGVRLGLYDGLTGVAHVLRDLGHHDAAGRIISIFLSDRWERLGTDLYGGLAGAALALLDHADATADAAARAAGLHAVEIVEERMTRWGAGQARPRAGLLRGASGPALLFVRMYERTGQDRFLDLASDALAADLGRCVTDGKQALQVDDGWRVLPYLDNGSVGIGMVLEEFLAHRADAGFAAAARAIRRAACSLFYAQSGLLSGRAGMLFHLARRMPAGTAADDPDVAAHVRLLAWHAVRYRDGLAFPGNQVFRLSMDLGTGTAGVLLALAAALSTSRGGLPFLPLAAGEPRANTAPRVNTRPSADGPRPQDTVSGERVPPGWEAEQIRAGR